MVKELSFTFRKCLETFTMWLYEGSLETGVFRHWSNKVFLGPYFRKYISNEGHLFFKNVQNLNQISKSQQKKFEKVFSFRDNCIWSGCVKLSPLKREYLPSALIVLGNSLEILHITNRDFLKVNCLQSDQWIW